MLYSAYIVFLPSSSSSLSFYFLERKKNCRGKSDSKSNNRESTRAQHLTFYLSTNFHTFLSLGVSFSTSFKSGEFWRWKNKKNMFFFYFFFISFLSFFNVCCLIASGRELVDGHSSLTWRRHRLFAFLFDLGNYSSSTHKPTLLRLHHLSALFFLLLVGDRPPSL